MTEIKHPVEKLKFMCPKCYCCFHRQRGAEKHYEKTGHQGDYNLYEEQFEFKKA